ncbi:pyrokinin-1 receptor-like [Sitodiplosis mosellana]|uniref:pyrokinin-1 receptor-like n=1 Tax=Sitodiplosis mosellana TaxID=263140 RepID=UPI002444C009|nr:pyrokinin-1 receptor-like [Sitodiplosis mosellana]XP_055323512.1 pyrokinin-1 receptor-like [Sitodiplosis mosellana]
MLFNRINHLFDQLNETLNVQTLHKWKELYLNGTTNDSYPIGNMISELNSSDLILDGGGFGNATTPLDANNVIRFEPEPLAVLILVTMCYSFIFVAGLLGNVITCAVIYRNKSMHTATNYYLFNLAISDLILLLSGMPQDTYNIWFPHNYRFTHTICILQGLLSETSTNATVLTIASFTIERYIAICHPFRQHTMSKLSRAVKFIMGVWIVAFCFAIPQAIQFGVVSINGGHSCTVQNILVEHAFEISSFMFFVGPMTLICVLYVLIGIKLRNSKTLQGITRDSCEINRSISGQTRIIRMLIAVAVAFFLCWAPFHSQRLMAVYGKSSRPTSELFRNIYTVLTYVSGVLYFMSTCINPLLYSIMSHKFRNAFKITIMKHCGFGTDYRPDHTYSMLSRYNGIGSLKLSMAAAHNQRISNPYISEVTRTDIAGQRNDNDTTDSAYAERPNDLSPMARMANAMRKAGKANQLKKEINDLNANAKFNLSRKPLKKNQQKSDSIHQTNEPNTVITGHGRKQKCIPKITSSNSICTTISNSSLQEYDDELDTTELAKYMRQINNEIHHDTK